MIILPARKYVIFSFLMLVLLFSPMASYAKQRIMVEVAGVSCPFCAFGLEKKLKQLPGAEKVTIKINEAKALEIFTSLPSMPSSSGMKKRRLPELLQ